MSTIYGANGCVILWVDLMKYGRLSGKDLDEVTSRVKKALSRKPNHSVCFMLAPWLVSERTSNGARGELRTWGILGDNQK